MFETLPEDVRSGLTETNLNEALNILSKKPKKSKQFFSRRAFAYQNIFYSFGHHHLGWTLGAISGKIISKMVSGEKTNLELEPYNSIRFS